MDPNVAYRTDGEDRLHSWKEIAVFLGHSVRTVQRWEAERSLPVHRTPGGKLGSVYAFKNELTRWMRQSSSSLAEPVVAAPPSTQSAESQSAFIAADESAAAAAPNAYVDGARETSSTPEPLPAPSPSLGWKSLLVALCLFVMVAIFTLRGPSLLTRASNKTGGPTSRAVELYLQGRYYWEKRDPASLERAIDLYTQAIVRDPSYSQAYSGLADCYNLLREFSTMPPEEAFPRAIEAASRAIQLDPNSAEAHNSLAFGAYYWKWDPAMADREFQTAIRLNPSLAVAHHWYANTLAGRNRSEQALREINLAQQLEPSSTAILGSKGLILLLGGRDTEGVALLQQLEAAQPDYLPPHDYLAFHYLQKRQATKFLAEQKFLAERSGDPLQTQIQLAAERGYAGGGYDRMLSSMLDVLEATPDGPRSHVQAAQFSALMGHRDQALQELKIAYRRHEAGISALSADRSFAALRVDAEFQNMAALTWNPPPGEPATKLVVLKSLANHTSK
jgi:tetratricopeptide (TPR) repeat protein